MAKTKYPKGFSIHSEPRFYATKPQETINKSIVLKSMKDVSSYETISVADIPDGTTEIKINGINTGGQWESDTIDEITFVKTEHIPNPNYEKELAKYQKDYEKHQDELKNWKRWKKIYEDERRAKAEENERKTYDRLKKKFDKLNG